MEEIKIAAVNAHENLRHTLFLLEHLRSDFENAIHTKDAGKDLIEIFRELIKTAMADVYTSADFLYQVVSSEDIDSLKIIIEDFKAKAEEV